MKAHHKHLHLARRKMSRIMDEIYNNIVTAVGGSFGEALLKAGESIPLPILPGLRIWSAGRR